MRWTTRATFNTYRTITHFYWFPHYYQKDGKRYWVWLESVTMRQWFARTSHGGVWVYDQVTFADGETIS